MKFKKINSFFEVFFKILLLSSLIKFKNYKIILIIFLLIINTLIITTGYIDNINSNNLKLIIFNLSHLYMSFLAFILFIRIHKMFFKNLLYFIYNKTETSVIIGYYIYNFLCIIFNFYFLFRIESIILNYDQNSIIFLLIYILYFSFNAFLFYIDYSKDSQILIKNIKFNSISIVLIIFTIVLILYNLFYYLQIFVNNHIFMNIGSFMNNMIENDESNTNIQSSSNQNNYNNNNNNDMKSVHLTLTNIASNDSFVPLEKEDYVKNENFMHRLKSIRFSNTMINVIINNQILISIKGPNFVNTEYKVEKNLWNFMISLKEETNLLSKNQYLDILKRQHKEFDNITKKIEEYNNYKANNQLDDNINSKYKDINNKIKFTDEKFNFDLEGSGYNKDKTITQKRFDKIFNDRFFYEKLDQTQLNLISKINKFNSDNIVEFINKLKKENTKTYNDYVKNQDFKNENYKLNKNKK